MNYIPLLLLLLSCRTIEKNTPNPLKNTKWEHKVAEGCISYIDFETDSTYEDYDCEMSYPFSGKYQRKNDTVYLIEIDLATDLPGEKREVIKGRSKYLLSGELLQYISWEEFENKKWQTATLPPQKILYKKLNKK